jgi:putative ABC transport system permease protein
LPLIAKPGRLRAVRADLGKTRRRWVRDVADVLVIWVAAAAVFVLNQRGLVAGSGQSGVDPLLVATPLLVALAACVIVLRLFPVPVTALSRLFKRRNGIVGFVGSVRAVRDPAAGIAPILALVVGMSVAIFSTVLWSTTNTGGVSSSIADIGADLRADGFLVFPEQMAAVEELPEVAAVATLAGQGLSSVVIGNSSTQAEIFVTDAAGLARVQEGLSGVAVVPESLGESSGGRVPVMASEEFAAVGDLASIASLGDLEVSVVETAPMVAGLATSRPWVLLDESALDQAGAMNVRRARTLLMAAADGAVLEPTTVGGLLDPEARFSTATDVLAEVRGGALGVGLMGSFVVAVVVVGVLSAVAVVLTLVVGAPARGRLLSQLRTLGLSGRQARGLASCEPPRGVRTLVMVSLPGWDETVSCSIVGCFDLEGCEVVDGFVDALVVEPVHPVQGLDLDVLDVAPGTVGTDQLGLVGADLGLGEGVVVGIAHRTHRRIHAGFDQTAGEGERGVLAAGIIVMHQPAQVADTGLST